MLLLMDSTSPAHKAQQVDKPERGHSRKETNRTAAQKSRRKQTERADALHEELQYLEHSNAAYEKEIAQLRQEIQRYTAVLQDHEPRCALPLPRQKLAETPVCLSAPTVSPARTDLTDVYGPFPDPAADPGPQPEVTSELFSDILDSQDWSNWDLD